MKRPRFLNPFIIRLMKISLIQMFLAAIFAGVSLAHSTSAQELLSRKVNLKSENEQIRKVLTEIERQVPVKFAYRPRTLPADQKITIDVINEPLAEVLEKITKPLGVSYEVIGQQIILQPSKRGTSFSEYPNSHSEPAGSVDKTVSGRVTDEAGEGLPGVNILVKGTQRGTISLSDGRFELVVPDGNNTLIFSFVGYLTREIEVGARSTIDVSLNVDQKSLEEVVVVGYGTVKKSDLTGSVASIKEEDIKATPMVALDRALQGRAAGVMVTQNSARPGGATTIRIRGTGSVNASNEPLYVIDGFPTTGNLNSINPNDIESIEILKDASATAIYGSRGSNGVVMVTTKRGREGHSNVNFESYYGVQTVRRKIPLLNAREYAEFINEARVNGGGAPYFDGSSADRPSVSSLGAGTNWQDEVFREAPIQSYQLSFTGGETKTRYAISGSYFNQQGIILNSYFKRYSLRANLDREVKPWLKIGLSMQGAYGDVNNARTETEGGINSGVTNAAINFAPTFPVYNAAGNYYRDQGPLNGNNVDNPLGIASEITDAVLTTRILANVFADVSLARGLTFRTSWGGDLFNSKSNYYATRLIALGANTNGRASVSAFQTIDWLNENTLTYSRGIGTSHALTALIGYTTQAYRNEGVTANAVDFNDDFALYHNLGAGATLQVPASSAGSWSLISYLARVNYGFDNRFLLTLTARQDGSSRFGPSNKYGFFPSGALAWRVINEKFMQDQRSISDLKFRFSYGLTGNQEIGDYRYLSSIAVAAYAFGGANPVRTNGGAPNGVSNLDLRWEKNAQTDIGFDLGVLNNRVQLTADYYIKTTSDLLFNVNIPLSTGYPASLMNIGKVRNRGVELSLSTINIDKGALRWSTEVNFAFNRNEVMTLDGRPDFLTGDGASHLNVSNTVQLKVGEPLGNFYGRVFDGIFQNQEEINNSAQKAAHPGDIRYVDLNSDGVIDDKDRTVIGNGYPEFFGGINNTISYKGFDLNFFFQGSYGNAILNYGRFDLYSLNGNNNQSREVLDRWTPANPSNSIPRANSAGGQRILSSFHVEDGSYLRLKTLSVGYNLPKTLLNQAKIQSAKIYFSAQNWLTFTRYQGYDPEVSRYGTSSISQGMDYGGYPTAKTALIGINLTF